MFGCCVRNSIFIVLILLGANYSWGQQPAPVAKENPNKAIKALVVNEPAYIFIKPDFDSEVIATLNVDKKIYYVSKGKWGPFHKIRINKTTQGYVLDSDIKLASAEDFAPKPKPQVEKKPKKTTSKKSKKAKTILNTNYGGPVLQLTNFTEDTMNSLRSQTLNFFGYKYSGRSRFFEDSTYIDANLLLYWGAPGYYSSATGKSASGWVLIGDFLMEATQAQSRDTMTFYGIGPVFRYSHIEATINEGAVTSDYSLDDAVLGAVVNAGIATRWDEKYALRFDGKYYWEKQKYWAFGLAFQFEF